MILFITRKYPPSVGGMEQLSYHLTNEMSHLTPTKVIAWGGSQKWLPVFVILACFRAVPALLSRKIRLIHVGDPVLSPVGLFLAYLGRKPLFTTAHGLDVTFPNPLYQFMISICLPRLQGIMCISEFARKECLKRGVSSSRCTVISPGVTVEARPTGYSNLERITTRALGERKVLLSVGRLVERKGFLWFIANVLPILIQRRPEIIYLLCGEGPERSRIEKEVQRLGLQPNILLLGQVERTVLQEAYAIADVFVMPNIQVRGTAEGFGLVSMEARAAGTPVVASDLEGIGESIINGEDGFMVKHENVDEFVQAISRILNQEDVLLARENIRSRLSRHASWSKMAADYLKQFNVWTATDC